MSDPNVFAENLWKSMKGQGTDDATLIRIVVSRAEIDLKAIKAAFAEKYNMTLWHKFYHMVASFIFG